MQRLFFVILLSASMIMPSRMCAAAGYSKMMHERVLRLERQKRHQEGAALRQQMRPRAVVMGIESADFANFSHAQRRKLHRAQAQLDKKQKRKNVEARAQQEVEAIVRAEEIKAENKKREKQERAHVVRQQQEMQVYYDSDEE
ncbi:MAG TPA: hypothetical protein VGT41_01885 [Candidatus Babeliales bacterium]|nr:hypothetical protein [Candidatus Babeliales bacterium]